MGRRGRRRYGRTVAQPGRPGIKHAFMAASRRSRVPVVFVLFLACCTAHAARAADDPAATRPTSQPALRTFCNPLDLDYGLRRANGATGRQWRHGADPCVVLFKDRYYLFSTWDRP